MAEIVFTIILLLISALLNHFSPIPNSIVEDLVELIPLIIIGVRLWWNRPRNYMYVIGIFNRNVKYQFSVKLETCDINYQFFNEICKKIKNLNGNNGKSIKDIKGEFVWQVYLEVDATLIEIEYNLENENLYIEARAKTKYKHFIKDVENISTKIQVLFAESSNQYDKSLINIMLWYINKSQEEITNPFLDKFFDKFNKIMMNLKYTAPGGSVFTITNKGVSVTGDDLSNIKDDLKNEMLLF